MVSLVGFSIISRFILLVLPWLLNPSSSWNRWDAPHYLYLSQHGYTNIGDEANFIVFFPLYPIIVFLLNLLLSNPVLSASLLSIIFFSVSVGVFYKLLIKAGFSSKIPLTATISLIVFPTSYFFVAPYTESLFFFLTVSIFFLALKKNWIGAGFLSALATLTRPFGLFVMPALVIEWLSTSKKKLRDLPFLILPSVFSTLIYLFINYAVYADAFAFQKILSSHWGKNFKFPFISILNSWRAALASPLTHYSLMVNWAEALSSTLAWLLIPVALIKLRRSWATLYALGVLLFTSTDFVLSGPRYLISLFPLFVIIGIFCKHPFIRIVWWSISTGLLFYFTFLFTKGQWAF